ncbi:hypothetical protein PTKIN_Ptkin14bG0108800 [Pterospermum kingtungense]
MWGDALESVFACAIGARWRKAAKCKRLIEQVQSSLTIRRERREAIVKQCRLDLAMHVQSGLLETAMIRADKLYKDQCLVSFFDQIEHFCECIISNISHITTQRSWQTLPVDAREAVASIVFAAAKCGKFPELSPLGNFFKELYGSEFEVTNVELRPGNLVNFQIQQNLCIDPVTDNMKQTLLNEVSKFYGVPPAFPDAEDQSDGKCSFEQKAEVLDLEIQDKSSDIDEISMQRSEHETQDKSSGSSHVNPSLPENEDLGDRLKDV